MQALKRTTLPGRHQFAGAASYANLFHCVPRSVPIQPSYVTERDEPRRRPLISRELEGNRQQQLRFNDTPGQISVQLGSDGRSRGDAGNCTRRLGGPRPHP
jgi:uncharacterized protein involved in type VI secretion and phage assembly